MNTTFTPRFNPRPAFASASACAVVAARLALSVALGCAALAGIGASAVAAERVFGTTDLKIVHPWARVTVAGQGTGTAFMSIENTSKTPERLLGASTPAADHVELHTMSMEGSVMKMRQVNAIDIAPGATVKLTPDTLHMMLPGLKSPLVLGTHVPLTLRFEKAGEVRVDLEVEPMSFGSDMPMKMH